MISDENKVECQNCGRVTKLKNSFGLQSQTCVENSIVTAKGSRSVTRASYVRVCDQILQFAASMDVLDHLVSFLVLPAVPPRPGPPQISEKEAENTLDPQLLSRIYPFNYFVIFPRHFRVDVLDTQHNWIPALVAECEKRLDGWWIQVYYNWWSAKWHEWLPWDTQIVQPIGTFTCHHLVYQRCQHKGGVPHQLRHAPCQRLTYHM